MNLGPYQLNQIYCGECSKLMESLPDNSIDMWLTSPPYDSLRRYHGFTFDFEAIATQLYRVTRLKSPEFVARFGQVGTILDIVDGTSKHKIVNTFELDKGKAIEDRIYLVY